MANRQSLSQAIVKQGYLRKAPTSNMFAATFKRAPLRWFVFGVRSHVGPYLEYYEDESSILTAPPINSIGLNQAKHITYCINGPKYDNTISITLADRVLTLVADSRGEMNHWFQAIQTKLVEIGILTEMTNTLSTVRENTYTTAPTLERPRTRREPDESDLADSHTERDPEQDTTDGTGSAYDFASIEEVVANRRNEMAERKTSSDSADDLFSPYVNSQASNGILAGNVYENSFVAAPNTRQNTSEANTPLEMNQAGNASLKPVMSKDSQTLRKCDINDNKCQSNDAPPYMNVQTSFQNPNSAFMAETDPSESYPNGIFMQVNEEESYEAIWGGQAESWSPERARSQSSRSSRLLHFVESTDSKNALADETNPLMMRSEDTEPKVSDQHSNDLHPDAQLARKLQEIDEDFDEPPPPYSPPEGASAFVPAIGRRRKVSLKNVVPSADRNLIGHRAQTYVNQPKKRSSSSSVESHERRHSARSASGGGQRPAQLQRSVTLKHSQIELLKEEMNHAAGVRVALRKVDSYKGIAFVDCIGAVWVAGWNLRDHPYLHGAFHVGDQLVSINKLVVQTARMAQKIIKHSDDLNKLAFIVRRVPHAKVFSVQRRAEGESLGVKRDGGTAEIVYIDPNGLAGHNGLKSKAKSLDGSTLTNWTLTEINNRPLNLFFKDNEIEHRLNAVGKDISFMVQPADFVKLLKKQLKSLKNYKDYLVQ